VGRSGQPEETAAATPLRRSQTSVRQGADASPPDAEVSAGSRSVGRADLGDPLLGEGVGGGRCGSVALGRFEHGEGGGEPEAAPSCSRASRARTAGHTICWASAALTISVWGTSHGDVTTFEEGVGDWPSPSQMRMDQRVTDAVPRR